MRGAHVKTLSVEAVRQVDPYRDWILSVTGIPEPGGSALLAIALIPLPFNDLCASAVRFHIRQRPRRQFGRGMVGRGMGC